jgi:hypothetical protein
MGVPNAIADKPERANTAYVNPITTKKTKCFLLNARTRLVINITAKRMRRPKSKRKNNCSKLDIPVLLRTYENIRMKLRPTVAEAM